MATPHFFSDDSFWNTPLNPGLSEDPQSDRWISLLKEAQLKTHRYVGLHLNLHAWTVPLFESSPSTKKVPVAPKILDCPLSQGHRIASAPYFHSQHPYGIHSSVKNGIPIPPKAAPDVEEDAHMVIIDRQENKVYDMWQLRQGEDGQWASNAAIAYDLKGSGVFSAETIAGIHHGESIHYYGPCRATGVPLVAGLILQEEILNGEIPHKLVYACGVEGLERFVSPAIWTDGWLPGGVPAGSILQLDPLFPLESLSLSPAAKVVARALQKYGAVLADNAGGVTLYGESLSSTKKSWTSLLEEDDLRNLDMSYFRIVETGPLQKGGSHPVYHHGMSLSYYNYIKTHGSACLKDYHSVP
ncbi:MAG: hypothetical protein V4507_13075 [Verrucomicrobiota bacterium]